MSIVVWDGTTMAADQQWEVNGVREKGDKLRVGVGADTCVAFVGDVAAGHLLMEWYREGRDPAQWPACQATPENSAVLIVWPEFERPRTWYREPIPITVHGPFAAWGDAREIALGAMAHGATAVEAVEICIQLHISCGFGVTQWTWQGRRAE